jgi:hypothetical protein
VFALYNLLVDQAAKKNEFPSAALFSSQTRLPLGHLPFVQGVLNGMDCDNGESTTPIFSRFRAPIMKVIKAYLFNPDFVFFCLSLSRLSGDVEYCI